MKLLTTFGKAGIMSMRQPAAAGRQIVAEQRREKKTKVKPNYVKNYKYVEYRKREAGVEVAKDYFDTNYKAIFGESLWRRVRCAMMSRKRYGCVVNNLVSDGGEKYTRELKQLGAVNLLDSMRQNASHLSDVVQKQIGAHSEKESAVVCEYDAIKFVEVSERLDNRLDDAHMLQYDCSSLKLMAFPRGDFTDFEHPTLQPGESVQPGFLLDAASCLPVLLLGLQKNETVLDMCSSPGGKLNTMLQILGEEGKFVANDVSRERVRRLKKTIKDFVPKESEIFENVDVVNYDARLWEEEKRETDFAKVLVDAPCTNDRVSMYDGEKDSDNMFSVNRKSERNSLPHKQTEILRNAILACDPGGTIVYSTCTISPYQNDFVVDYVINQLREEDDITVTSENLDIFVDSLSDNFNFIKFKGSPQISPHGVLVYPTLDANFGPMYMAKLTREVEPARNSSLSR